MKNAKVALLMGSKNDLPKLQPAIDTLSQFGVPLTVRVMSAHRTPATVAEFATNARANGLQVMIAAAGGAAHLAGVVAAHTTLPVIGIPVEGGALNGLDALLATVQMPGGIAVATVGIGSGGAMNAALIAVQILALNDPALAERFECFRADQREKVAKADSEVVALDQFR
jgi:5-(carboxyamino)imidazole ribonucleotide mutase